MTIMNEGFSYKQQKGGNFSSLFPNALYAAADNRAWINA